MEMYGASLVSVSSNLSIRCETDTNTNKSTDRLRPPFTHIFAMLFACLPCYTLTLRHSVLFPHCIVSVNIEKQALHRVKFINAKTKHTLRLTMMWQINHFGVRHHNIRQDKNRSRRIITRQIPADYVLKYTLTCTPIRIAVAHICDISTPIDYRAMLQLLIYLAWDLIIFLYHQDIPT